MTTVLESLNAHLHQVMEKNNTVYLLGEDILDPYGGAFKVTKGLSTKYPDRVLTTPISEAAMVGIAGGMALRGLRPVVEIMFGDFLTLAADQIINSLTKFRWMYNDKVEVPIVIRTPMGGRRGYGPTHSQSLEKHFIGTPGLQVLAPCAIGDPGKILSDVILQSQQPTLFVENKMLYLKKINDKNGLADFNLEILKTNNNYAPTYKLTIKDAPPAVLTLTAYGYMAELTRQAALKLAYEYEIFTEIIIPTQLAPVEINDLLISCQKTRRLLSIEEGTYTLGWGAEILARCKEELNEGLIKVGRVAANDSPIPASITLEEEILPSIEKIIQTALKMV